MKFYKSAIRMRTKNTYCVHVPKTLVDNELFKLGAFVLITLEKLEPEKHDS